MPVDEKLTFGVYAADSLPEMVDVFAACFPAEAWTVDDFNAFWTKPSRVRSNIVKTLTDAAGRVRGVMLYSVKPNVCVLRRVGVPAAFRRRGLARQMMAAVCGPTTAVTCNTFTAAVAKENGPMISLLTAAGFLLEPASACSPVFVFSRHK